jgi:hypothetical protein
MIINLLIRFTIGTLDPVLVSCKRIIDESVFVIEDPGVIELILDLHPLVFRDPVHLEKKLSGAI